MFYGACCRVLGDDGLFMQQVASPFFTPDIFVRAFYSMRQTFSMTSPVLIPAPFYVSSDWSLGLASSSDTFFKKEIPPGYWDPIPGLRYYNPDVHRASFALPNFTQELWTRSAQSPNLS